MGGGGGGGGLVWFWGFLVVFIYLLILLNNEFFVLYRAESCLSVPLHCIILRQLLPCSFKPLTRTSTPTVFF